MTLCEAVILGILQGLTEFLPVSSSGHLVLGQYLLGLEHNLTFDVVVHFGTLLAIIIALFPEVQKMLIGLLPGSNEEKRQGRHLLMMVIIGTIPAAVIGLLFSDAIERLFASVYTTGIMLIVTGTLLYLADKASTRVNQPKSVGSRDALLIGCGQALAILPGLSRSGTTLSVGLWRGLSRSDGARFAFLLAIPTILGAAILELPEAISAATIGIAPLVAGMITAMVTGYLAIRLFLVVVKNRLVLFSYYTWLLGSATLILAFVRR